MPTDPRRPRGRDPKRLTPGRKIGTSPGYGFRDAVGIIVVSAAAPGRGPAGAPVHWPTERWARNPMSAVTFQGWLERVERLCEAEGALERVAGEMGLPPPHAAWHEALFAKLRPQLARAPFLVVAVTGGTNTGKSTIFNNLLGARASRVTATAMGSKHPVCILPRDFRDFADLGRIFPGFEVRPWTSEADPLTDTPAHLLFHREDPGGLLPNRLVLLDTPDVDGSLSDHWERARLVRGAADVLLAVLTQQKHNDATVRRFFSEAAGAEKVVFVAFNMVQWPDDRDDCAAWLRVFRDGTGVEPAHVYVAPHDRTAAEALALPFLGLDGSPRSPVRDLADLHFDEIKVRTFGGSLRLVLDESEGLPAFLRAVAARAGEYAEVGATLADGLRVELTPPTLPGRVIVDAVWGWLEPERTRFDRTVHGAYARIGRLILAPFLTSHEDDEGDYKAQELTMLSQALKTILDRLEETRRTGNALLRGELDKILGGDGREEIFRALTDRHGKATVLSAAYREFVKTTLDRFKADYPRLIRTVRYSLIATAVARPALTLVMFGGPSVASELAHQAAAHAAMEAARQAAAQTALEAARQGVSQAAIFASQQSILQAGAEAAHQAALHTGIQVAGELAVGTAVSVGSGGAAAGMRRPVLGLMTRLFTRFYEDRAALLTEILHESVLGRSVERIGTLARAARGEPFLEATALVESLARDLTRDAPVTDRTP